VKPGYVLPLRWDHDDGLAELTDYLDRLSTVADVVVVDGSPPELFARHALRWAGRVRHVAVDPDLRFRNGKVNGVLTGVRLLRTPYIVIADDDVRYDAAGLAAVVALLGGADLVLPQNFFAPLPWHARWDTGRMLLNRALGHDFPGTLAIRRETLARCGGYHGDVLFENLELIRTVRAHGGTVRTADHVPVRRLPPSAGRFWSQRIRQAYDSLAQPVRLLVELAVLPMCVVGILRSPRSLVTGVALVVALAEFGRRRAGGGTVFPADAALWAPAWLAERGVCSWLAVLLRVRHGGVRYAGHRIRVAAHSTTWLRGHLG
jgi:hypothetical protein